MKKIEDFTLEELKALAYDLIAQREQCQARLNAVNQLIVNFKTPQETPQAEPPKETPKEVEK